MALEFNHTAPAPFNPDFRPGFDAAVERAYNKYCDSPMAPQHDGPCEIRAAAYAHICKRLQKKYPTV